MSNLILTADDYGVIDGIDNAILEAAKAGRINSIAVLPNASDAPQRLQRLRQECPPEVEIGCHFTLTSGSVVSSPEKVPSLHRNGKFFSHKELNYAMNPEEVKIELRAQLGVFEAENIKVKHLSSHHKALDFFEPVHKAFLQIAHEYSNRQIPIRSPFNRPKFKQYLYIQFLATALQDDLPDEEIDRFLAFARRMTSVRKVNLLLKEYGFPRPKIKLPSYLDSSHFGLPDSRLIPEHEIIRISKNRRKRLLRRIKRINRIRPVELLFHLIEDDYGSLLNGKFNQQIREANYPGIDSNYFDGRIIEMKSLMGISEENLRQRGAKKISWSEL